MQLVEERPEGSLEAIVERPSLAGQTRLFVKAMRLKQWTKNAVVFAALIFSGHIGNLRDVGLTCLAFLLFSLVSSATYVINDYRDRQADRNHPRKQHRPLASGRLHPQGALAAAIVLLVAALGGSFAVSLGLGLVVLGYVANSLAYSFWLKEHAIIDVLAIAAGFVLRAVAGAVAIAVPISPWLLVCTGFLSLFLGFGKRRKELSEQEDRVGTTRRSLTGYVPELLDQMLTVVAACTIMSYSMYTFISGRSVWLMATIPFIFYGIFRYQSLVYGRGQGEAPDQTLLEDVPLQATILFWCATAGSILYFVK